MRRDATEARAFRLEIAKHRIAEYFVAVAGVVHDCDPGFGSGRGEVDQPLRLAHRKRAEKHLVEHREDRRVRADAKRQRENGDDRHERRPKQRAEREPQVEHAGFQRVVIGDRRHSFDSRIDRKSYVECVARTGIM